MGLPQTFKVLSFLMVLFGIMSLLLTGYFSSEASLLILLVLLLGVFFWETKLHTPLYSWIWNLITIIYLIFLLHDLLNLNIIIAAARLSIFLQIYKIYNKKTNKDYTQMYLISFFQFVSCTSITTRFYFLPLAALYIIIALWTLVIFHIKKQLEKHEALKPEPSPQTEIAFPQPVNAFQKKPFKGVLTPPFFVGTFLVSITILALSFMIFYLFPRREVIGHTGILGSFPSPLVQQAITGISGTVDLTTTGIVNEDPSVVMKIELPHASIVPDKILWRVSAASNFDGTRWIHSTGSRFLRRTPAVVDFIESNYAVYPTAPGLYITSAKYDDFTSPKDFREKTDLLEQKIILEMSFLHSIVSAFSPPAAIEGRFEGFTVGFDHSYRSRRHLPRKFSYTVFSDIKIPSPPKLRSLPPLKPDDPLYDFFRLFYMKTPKLSEKVDDLLISQDSIDINSYTNNYDKVMAVKDYLERNYIYTMNIRRTPGVQNPLEDFLFHTKSGHCEYFASAMAVLLRKAGIPCRIAYGFNTGEWNQYGNFFTIRQRDAHAWVEVFFKTDENHGFWIPFDPSARRAELALTQNRFFLFFKNIRKFLDAIKTKWFDNNIIHYSRLKQRKIAAAIVGTAQRLWKEVSETAKFVWLGIADIWKKISRDLFLAILTPLAVVCLVTALALIVRAKIKQRIRFRHIYIKNQPKFRTISGVKFYERMLKTLMVMGLTKKNNQTPLEFAQSLSAHKDISTQVDILTRFYYPVRFGRIDLKPPEVRRINQQLALLKKIVFLKK